MLEQLKKNMKTVVEGGIEHEDSINTNLPEKYIRRVKINKIRMRKEFHINAQVAGFQIRDTILDLGSDVNILPKKTWEALGKPKFSYSPIQLRMEN